MFFGQLIEKYKDKRDIHVVFANTGKEREETLLFVHQCDVHFGFNTVWVETEINPEFGKGGDVGNGWTVEVTEQKELVAV